MGFSGLTRTLLGKPGKYQGLKGKGRIPTDDLIPNGLGAKSENFSFVAPTGKRNSIDIMC